MPYFKGNIFTFLGVPQAYCSVVWPSELLDYHYNAASRTLFFFYLGFILFKAGQPVQSIQLEGEKDEMHLRQLIRKNSKVNNT